MAHELAALHRPTVRAPPRSALQASRSPLASPSAAAQLQQRLGNEGAQRLLASAQRSAAVSSPHDPAELEAHATARRVVGMTETSAMPSAAGPPSAGAQSAIQRSANAVPAPN